MTSISSPARGFGGALDLGVAGLAAASIGFLAFAMPQDLFSLLVGATHLPDVVAAAAPPLGAKARYAVMGAAALSVFFLVWSLLRALDTVAAAGSAPRPAPREAEPDAPRVRRADAHPDAPARRPLLARADLGEPEADPYELDEPRAYGGYAAAAPEPEYGPEPDFESVPASRLPRFMAPREREPEVEPIRDPVVPSARKRVEGFGGRTSQASDTAQADSINSLMSRLERGLAERDEESAEPDASFEPNLPPSLADVPNNPEATLSPEGVRHRLRSAISDLNQQAGRG